MYIYSVLYTTLYIYSVLYTTLYIYSVLYTTLYIYSVLYTTLFIYSVLSLSLVQEVAAYMYFAIIIFSHILWVPFFINIWLYSCLILQFMYFYWKRLCIDTVVYVFLDAATLTEVFPCFFLSCKANARI